MSCSSKLKTLIRIFGGGLVVLVVGMYGSSAFAAGTIPPFVASTTCATADSLCYPNYAVTYFSGNASGLPDESVRVVNTGLIGDPLNPYQDANICVNFYVFNTDQELAECCSCPETADALLQESVQTQLTANPLTGVVPTAGVIKITATWPSFDQTDGLYDSCSPVSYGVLPTNEVMAAFGEHLQDNAAIGATVVPAPTETNLINRPLSYNELNTLLDECYFAGILGSGKGSCACSASK